MVGRTQAVVAVTMAYVVLVILVSPAAPSPMTTVPSKHTLQPLQFIAPVTALLFTAAAENTCTFYWMVSARPAHPALNGSAIVDLTSARLC